MAKRRELRVEISGDSSGAQKALGQLDTKTEKSGGLLNKLFGRAVDAGPLGGALEDVAGAGGKAGAGVQVAAAAVGAFAVAAAKSVKAAADLGEAQNATNVTFGDGSKIVSKFAEDAAESTGLSNRAALEAANGFGNLFTNIGASEKVSANASVSLTRLGADLASFRNLAGGAQEANQKLLSGLVGETEALRSLGIVINEADVKRKAYTLGIAKEGAELTEAQKIQSRYALIMEQTSKAQGDFANTSDSLANQQRILQAQFENIQAQIGTGLIPVVEDLGAAFGGVFDLLDLAASPAGGMGGFVEMVAKALNPVVLLGDAMQQFKEVTGTAEPTAAELTRTLEIQEIQMAASKEEQKALTEAQKESTKAAKEQEKALDELLKAQLGSINADIGLENAIRKTRDASEAQSKAFQAAHAAKGLDTEANRRNEEATQSLKEAIISEAAAVVAKAKADEEATGATLSQAQANDIFKAKLLAVAATLEPGSPLRVELEGYAGQLQSLPVAKETLITALTDTSQAEAQFRAFEREFANRSIVVNFEANLGQLARAADAVGDRDLANRLRAGQRAGFR